MRNLSYKTVLKYLFAFVLFAAADAIVKGVPLSISVFSALLTSVFSPIFLSVFYLIFVFITFPLDNAMLLSISVVFLTIIFLLYKLKKRKIGAESIIFVLVSLLPFLFGNFVGGLNVKLVYSAIIAILAFILTQCFNLVFIKKFSFRMTLSEKCALAISVIYFSLGAIEIFGFNLWQCIALTVMLFSCYFYKNTKALIPALVLPVALALHSNDLSVIALFEIYCAAALIFSNYSKLLSAFSVIVAKFAVLLLSGNVYTFGVSDYIYYFIPVVIFLFIPKSLYSALKKRITKFDEPEITREVINLERTELSARLYGISDVFKNLENGLNLFECKADEADETAEKIADEVIKNVCEKCNAQVNCSYGGSTQKDDLKKLASIGLSKGKVNLIDLSRDFSSYCFNINDMLSELNRLLMLYEKKSSDDKNTAVCKSLITMQAYGVSEILKDMAFNFSEKIYFGKKEEKILFDKLCLSGIVPKQLVYLGTEYHMLFKKERIPWSKVAAIVSGIALSPYKLLRKTDVGDGILAVFAKSPSFDATFGFSQKTKAGSEKSGDNFSLTKINEGKFLVAISDGMGSGEKASLSSETAISLIENFYAAGLNSDIVLKITSNLLSSCFEDSFSTLDSAIIDLYAGKCDIIKVGATFGFLIKEEGTRIIENESLPLGVLQSAEPTCQSFSLDDNDILVIMSDGVTDAFFSSIDAMEFLTREKTPNPQLFADKILEYALSLSNGKANDDMTVLVVKIYKNALPCGKEKGRVA